jgi:SAM-dependent methyltransferase
MALARALRTGHCLDDREFDSLLPRRWRAASWRYWTPLAAVARAAAWLDELGVRSVVDIGAGTGKFCVAGALLGRAHFIGVEQRAELVETARVLSRAYGVAERVSFLHETFGEVAPPLADAYYFFNPFGENLFSWKGWLDDSVELSEGRYARELRLTRRWLAGAKPGTYVLTYNGIGESLPVSYRPVRVDRELPCVLKLWQQQAPY